KNGWQIELLDSVRTRLRLHQGDGSFVAEWLLPDRDVAVPAELDIKLFQSYAAYFNIRAKTHRDAGLVDDAASLGACPWKWAMLSAVLALWALMLKQNDAAAPADWAAHITIAKGVVTRALRPLEILGSILAGADARCGRSVETTSELSKAEPAAPPENEEERAASQLARAPPPLDFNFAERAHNVGLMDTDVAGRFCHGQEAPCRRAQELRGSPRARSTKLSRRWRRSARTSRSPKSAIAARGWPRRRPNPALVPRAATSSFSSSPPRRRPRQRSTSG
ncbi:unnamed protein product, partial [Prorocentrum cordatum]